MASRSIASLFARQKSPLSGRPPLHPSKAQVKVVVRKRPVGADEVDVVKAAPPKLLVNESKVKVDLTRFRQEHTFTFDDTYGEFDDTRCVYDRCLRELVENVFNGGTSKAFCFGQTASGKTHTLFGEAGGKSSNTGKDTLGNGGGASSAAAAAEAGLGVKVEAPPSPSTTLRFSFQGDAARGDVDGLYLLAAHSIYERVDAFAALAAGMQGRKEKDRRRSAAAAAAAAAVAGESKTNNNGGIENAATGSEEDEEDDDDDDDDEDDNGDEDVEVTLSMYEIKGQKLFDLLNRKAPLKALEDERGVLQLVGLTQHRCKTLGEVGFTS